MEPRHMAVESLLQYAEELLDGENIDVQVETSNNLKLLTLIGNRSYEEREVIIRIRSLDFTPQRSVDYLG